MLQSAVCAALCTAALVLGTVAVTSWWLGHATLDPDRFAHAMTDTLAEQPVRVAATHDARQIVDTAVDDLGIPVGEGIRAGVARRLAATATGPHAANLWRFVLAKAHRLAFESGPHTAWGLSGAETWWVVRPALVDAAGFLDTILPAAAESVGTTDSIRFTPADLLPPMAWLADSVDALRNLPWIAGLAAIGAAAGALALSRRRRRLLVICAGGLVIGCVVPFVLAQYLPGAFAGIGLPGETLPLLISGTVAKLLGGWWHASLSCFVIAAGFAAAAFAMPGDSRAGGRSGDVGDHAGRGRADAHLTLAA